MRGERRSVRGAVHLQVGTYLYCAAAPTRATKAGAQSLQWAECPWTKPHARRSPTLRRAFRRPKSRMVHLSKGAGWEDGAQECAVHAAQYEARSASM